MTDVLGYAYGLTVFTGGAIGYMKGKKRKSISCWIWICNNNMFYTYKQAGSTASLLAGTIFGLLAALGAYTQNVKLSLIVSLVLLYVMGSRFYRGGKFMPAGLVSILR